MFGAYVSGPTTLLHMQIGENRAPIFASLFP